MANSVEVLMDVLEYIEKNIAGEISVEEIAKECGISVSSMQKRFKYIFHMPVKEYILRRRFTCAAKDLINTEDSILTIALKYGYSNHESFTRGFRQVWMITPNEYRKKRHFTGHTPKLSKEMISDPEGDFMSRTKYDITELYDVLRQRKDNVYVCADIKHLMWVNDNLGRKAGDAVILETMRRIEEACSEDDIFLRIGGDEFVVFTNSSDRTHADEMVNAIRNDHGKITVDGKEITVETHVGAFVGFPDRISAKNVFNMIAGNIDEIHRT
ncbi:MAG: helix-turn-helix domain-containing protein [Clostridiales bacterium]|nr:helix-turn-helix domain-containing protein [Clostridiales bacterium]